MTSGITTAAAAPESRLGALERTEAGDRSLGAIVTDLWEKTEKIVRQEMKLGLTEAEEKIDSLKIELEDKAQDLKRELIAKAIGGLVAFTGLLVIAAAIVLVLALWMKPWLAALLVGVAFSATGAVLLKRDMHPAKSGSIQLTHQDSHATQETSHDPVK
jgi:Putative Actinobacterial Holin-X, holin superfamily III